jgi:hypothetical protein
MLFDLSVIAILGATILGMFLGALWYSPLLFGHQWQRSIGKTQDDLGNMTGPMIGSIIANLITAIGLTFLFSIVPIADIYAAITLGLLLGLFIIFPALLSDNLFCGWGISLLLIQSGYRILTVLFMSILIFYLS